jgi:hypothetical protein
MKKFRAGYFGELEEFEIIKETEKQVIYISKSGEKTRENKLSNWAYWFDKKEDAVNYLGSKEKEKLESALIEIEGIIERLRKLYSY